MRALVAVCALSLGTLNAVAQTKVETVRLRILNGHSGKPLKDVMTYTTVYPLLSYRYPIDARTDAQGRTTILVPTDGQILPAVRRFPTCVPGKKAQQRNAPTTFPVSTILAAGMAEPNRCGHRNVQSAPGELVVFVRPRHWWERFSY